MDISLCNCNCNNHQQIKVKRMHCARTIFIQTIRRRFINNYEYLEKKGIYQWSSPVNSSGYPKLFFPFLMKRLATQLMPCYWPSLATCKSTPSAIFTYLIISPWQPAILTTPPDFTFNSNNFSGNWNLQPDQEFLQ